MIPPTIVLVLTITAFLAGALLGWDFAVHHFNASKRKLAIRIADLEQQVAVFRDSLDADPQRAWIDLGKRSIVSQIEATLRLIRTTMEPRS